MQNICAAWLYPIVLIAGALQAWGPPMNGDLQESLSNPWLASTVSFLPIVAFLTVLFSACRARCRRWTGYRTCSDERRSAGWSARSRSLPDCCSLKR